MNLLAQMLIRQGGGHRREKTILTGCLLLLSTFVASNNVLGQSSVTLQWDGNSDDGFGGFWVYYGTTSASYANRISAGTDTQITISGLTNGITYYFAATSYLLDGTESDFSAELAYTPGGTNQQSQAILSLRMNAGGAPIISGVGIQNHTYQVETSSNNLAWSFLGDTTADANGNFTFEDAYTPVPLRFYRAKDVSP